jgi:hypothetical protein
LIFTVTDKPRFSPAPDRIEYALRLVDQGPTRSFPEEINELAAGLELLEEILDGMNTIHL